MRPSLSELAGASPDLKKTARRPRPQKSAAAADPDRLPPHAMEAERGVLGCVFLNPVEGLSVCQERGCAAAWFYDLPHQVIYQAVADMEKAGVKVDLISAQQWLKDAGQLEQVGGLVYLSELQDVVPSAANLVCYLDILEEKWTLRQMVRLGSGLVGRVYDYEGEVDSLVAEVQREVLALSESHVGAAEESVGEIMPRVIDDLDNYHRGGAQMRGLSTGFAYLDKMLCGIGGEDNNFIVLAGRPGMGKTSLALDIVLHVALDHPRYEEVTAAAAAELEAAGKVVSRTEAGKCYAVGKGLPVAIFSLEMTKKALVQRMIFQRSQADAQRWRTGFAVAADFEPMLRVSQEIHKAPIWIDDTARCTIDELKARARRLHRQQGVRLFVVDYMQLLRSGDRRFRDDRVQELEEISGELQKLGKELKTPFIILAQMNRDAEKDPNREPRLSDLKNCGAIEQDADVVGFLWRPKKSDEDEQWLAAMEKLHGDDWSKYPKLVELLLAKARNGPTGPVKLLFQKSSTHFHDWFQWLKDHHMSPPAAGERRSPISDADVVRD